MRGYILHKKLAGTNALSILITLYIYKPHCELAPVVPRKTEIIANQTIMKCTRQIAYYYHLGIPD